MHMIKLDAIDSTNDYLRKLILKKKPTTPTVVMSQYQKKGKGQRGQVWTSQAGKNLMFSLTTKLIECLTPPIKNYNDDYHKYLYGLGQSRLFLKDKKTFEGIIQSVNSEGKLVLKTTAGEQVFDVKELQFVHVADQ